MRSNVAVDNQAISRGVHTHTHTGMTQGSSKICYKTRHNNTSFITQELNAKK